MVEAVPKLGFSGIIGGKPVSAEFMMSASTKPLKSGGESVMKKCAGWPAWSPGVGCRALSQTAMEEEDLALAYGDKSFVSIATGTRQLLRKAPSTSTVITAEDIAAMGPPPQRSSGNRSGTPCVA